MITILKVENLSVSFHTNKGVCEAVKQVSFRISSEETLGMVGESGCGKSVTALSILRLLPTPPGKITDGKIFFENNNLLELSSSEMRRIRGNKISMIFQEPMTSLNPVFTIGNQILETLMIHQNLRSKEAIERTVDMLKSVGIPAPEKRLNDYPHQLSGGMRQRIIIAISLLCNPKILIADEPTTALDVTIESQMLDLMMKLKKESGTAILLITHNLGIIAEHASRVIVLYAGRVVEEAEVKEIFKRPHHPYTIGLIQSLISIERCQRRNKERLYEIPGAVPDPYHFPHGCKFAPRCSFSDKRCQREEPGLRPVGNQHFSACWLG